MTVGVIKVLDNAFCPLKGFFSESPPAVKRHHRGKVLQLLALLSADPCDIVRTGDAQVIGLLIVHDKVWKQSNEVHWETKALGWVNNSKIELSCHPRDEGNCWLIGVGVSAALQILKDYYYFFKTLCPDNSICTFRSKE